MLLSRSYFKDDKWHDTSFFSRDDLLLVSEVARQAFKYVDERQDEQPPQTDAVEEVPSQISEMEADAK